MPQLRLIPGVHRTTHRIGLYIQRHAPDLTQAEAHILCHLIETGEATISDLHRAFAHRRSTLTSVLDRLVARGLVTRESNQADRRSFVIGLTRAGKAKAASIHKRLEQFESEALRGADLKEITVFEQIIAGIERAAGR